MALFNEIICAPATLSGGAIAVVRISGEGAIELADKMFRKRGSEPKRLEEAAGYTLHYGDIVDGVGDVVDDVMLSLFRAPHSFTGEDGVEISCHGSSYIVQRIIELAIDNGARMATAGEFTTRAFMAGRIDLSQAEAVADMIAVSDRATHKLAQSQMRGGYSEMLEKMREELLHLSALMELELDFSQEDVEFASRDELRSVVERLVVELERLAESFTLGNAIKSGIGVAIVGAPNAGKSTLLNRILGEDRAMVSSIAGTTRDSIEEQIRLDGVAYRFIDTAGLHESEDELEKMGIERTYAAILKADVVVEMLDIATIATYTPIEITAEQKRIRVVNKLDTQSTESERVTTFANRYPDAIFISARDGLNVDVLLDCLSSTVDRERLYGGDIIVSNSRHYEHLRAASESLRAAQESQRCDLPADLIVEDLRYALQEIGSITGAITNDEILGHIFSSFCIGK